MTEVFETKSSQSEKFQVKKIIQKHLYPVFLDFLEIHGLLTNFPGICKLLDPLKNIVQPFWKIWRENTEFF